MFPNPQDALPLPLRPNLERYKKLAKDLVKACTTAKSDAVREWTSNWIHDLARLSQLQITPGLPVEIERWIDQVTDFAIHRMLSNERNCSLTDAQFVIARSHGFASWPKFSEHLEQLAQQNSSNSQFEAAAEAIISGDLPLLKRLVYQNPALVRERSTREHHATLLHYTSANGVEGYRQKTPQTIVGIAQFLLQSGAEIDAEADVYGGGCTTLGLTATSIHPEVAGVQEDLLRLLLDHGAQIDKPNLAGNNQSTVIACLANGRGRAAEFLAAHGARLNLESAAGIGRLDVVESCFDSQGNLKLPATKQQLQHGFLWACMYGRDTVAKFLLDHGADFLHPAGSGATPLHWAAGGAHPNVVRLLLDRGAPLEELNQWGGTVLEHAGYGFEHSAPGSDFGVVFDILLAGGAKIRGNWLSWIEKLKTHSPEEKAGVSEIFRRHGATQ